ncbi:glucosidase II beta subunit-like protein-domain-containing protein [Stachybotrys elegans]|uniref:Endoplasmic reticulum lectin n=1 Tax=Stachybotrys elegans TaxID=80388 RepID=A0A8K0STC3_9HYPO|nr:glucosidase II beta subunit-like protein-domain-containing protein [Stachybotrys elegans]
MRRFDILLLAALQLCEARSRGFSIHEDLLAFPQFEVIFSENFISEKDATALLESNAQGSTYTADFSQPTVGEASENDINGQEEGSLSVERTYEVMNMSPHRYLCSIPIMQPPPPENQTETELAKAEEAQELSRAAANGWELLSKLDDTCLYFMSGWWSYSFCNNREIVQFHAVTSITNGQPPRPDPNSAEYVLGKVPAISASSSNHRDGDYDDEPLPAELQVKGDQRYLVQRLVGGTICDLTGRERTIEVQYHCAPNVKTDRIGWIKEVTICAYLMVINTPRLCNDVAFLPPQEKKANPISCSLIVDDDKATPLIEQGGLIKGPPMQIQKSSTLLDRKAEVNVGGVVVGARHILSAADEVGKPPVRLSNSRQQEGQGMGKDEKVLELIAKMARDEENKIEIRNLEDLADLELDAELVQELRQAVENMAEEEGWRIEVVEIPGDGASQKKKPSKEEDEAEEDNAKEGEGSQEEFKDEL